MLGKYNHLTINRFVDFGAYLDGGDLGEILIPKKYIPEGSIEGDAIHVFVHLDGEERYVATTEDVKAEVGQVAFMEIVAVSGHGAFADWGLVKNLFIPFREQAKPLEVGDKTMVYVYVDELTYRIVGSTRIEKYINNNTEGLVEKDKVDIIIWRKTPNGYLAIINNQCLGMIYDNQIFGKILPGEQTTAFIKKIRGDGKVDLILQEEGYAKVVDFADTLWEYIEAQGSTQLSDNSSPEEIYTIFKVSKKVFKKAVGSLLKSNKIIISDKGIIKKG